MIRHVTIKNFKRFREHKFDLSDSVVLAGPNNTGKSTLLQAIATWKLCLNQWMAQRKGSKAVKRSGVAIHRNDITSVPLREMSLLWENRKVTGPKGMSGRRRLIEINLEGEIKGQKWNCGIEIQYMNSELIYARPKGTKELGLDAIKQFPPEAAKSLNIVHVPPLSGIDLDEPRRDRGMQDLLVGQGRPGEVLRNLLWEIAENKDVLLWQKLQKHIHDLFQIELIKPSYSPNRPYIICEYKEPNLTRPLDLSNVGSGTLQVLLLVAFLYARDATVILIDEPDAHQHIVLQRQVYDLIRKVAHDQHGQVIVATHSEVILNATPPERVLGFLGQTPFMLASTTERDQLREALKRITTTELLIAQETGNVLYVEGESDERILTEWARILDHPARTFFERGFVHVLGGRNLKEARAHFFAIKATTKDIRGICLIDGDNQDKPDKEFTKADLKLLQWDRYEIENYLLQPEAIIRFVENLPLLQLKVKEHVEGEFYKEIPKGTNLFGKHVALIRMKASNEFLIPLLKTAGMEIPKLDLYLMAAVMKAEEIHPEVVEKLDYIAKQFGITQE